jgi:hypothetical protein
MPVVVLAHEPLAARPIPVMSICRRRLVMAGQANVVKSMLAVGNCGRARKDMSRYLRQQLARAQQLVLPHNSLSQQTRWGSILLLLCMLFTAS